MGKYNRNNRTIVDEVRAIWNRIAPFWSKSVGDGNRFHLDLVAPTVEQLLAVREGQRILDLACGHGHFSRRLVNLGASVVASDISEEMLRLAKARLADMGDQVQFVHADATDRDQLLGLRSFGPFDAIVANMALMDIPDIAVMAEALPFLLRRDRPFVVSVLHPCFNSVQGCRLGVEEEDRGGEIVAERYVRISQYVSSYSTKSTGIIGQPEPHYYFHRSLSMLLQPFFANNWTLDALEEPASRQNDSSGRLLSWQTFSEIPPVLAVRLRHATGP